MKMKRSLMRVGSLVLFDQSGEKGRVYYTLPDIARGIVTEFIYITQGKTYVNVFWDNCELQSHVLSLIESVYDLGYMKVEVW